MGIRTGGQPWLQMRQGLKVDKIFDDDSGGNACVLEEFNPLVSRFREERFAQASLEAIVFNAGSKVEDFREP